MVKACLAAGLKEPDLIQDESFKTILWRKESTDQVTGEITGEAGGEVTGEAGGEVTEEAGGEVTESVKRIVLMLKGEMKRGDIQNVLQLKHDDFFRTNYIIPALEAGYIEMTNPENPTHPGQRYRLTKKGKVLLEKYKKAITEQITPHHTPHVTDHDDQTEAQVEAQAEAQVVAQIINVLSVLPLSSGEIALKLGHKKLSGNLRKTIPMLREKGIIEYTIPDIPKSKNQKYCLTTKGKALQQQLKKQKK